MRNHSLELLVEIKKISYYILRNGCHHSLILILLHFFSIVMKDSQVNHELLPRKVIEEGCRVEEKHT